jgi:hypothetical protein
MLWSSRSSMAAAIIGSSKIYSRVGTGAAVRTVHLVVRVQRLKLVEGVLALDWRIRREIIHDGHASRLTDGIAAALRGDSSIAPDASGTRRTTRSGAIRNGQKQQRQRASRTVARDDKR